MIDPRLLVIQVSDVAIFSKLKRAYNSSNLLRLRFGQLQLTLKTPIKIKFS